MYDQSTMNTSLYSQFMGGNQMYGNMPMSMPQVQAGLGNTAPTADTAGMPQGAQLPSTIPSTMPQPGMSEMERYRIMAQGLQGMGRGMQQQPLQNTSQIIPDKSRPQFAGYAGGGQAMNPQQQMAMALRNRG